MISLFEAAADALVDHGFAVMDQFLSQDEVRAILSLPEFQGGLASFRKAGIGNKQDRQVNEAIRGDYIRWVDRTHPPAAMVPYFQKMDALVTSLNRSLFLSLKDFEVHQTVYPVGSFYKRHLDQFRKDDRRKLSTICYLNEGWLPEHGGQLRLYAADETRDFLPVAGRLVVFRSDSLEHEVLPATRERLSLTGWLLDRLQGT